MCVECCRGYDAACLCGMDHFNRKLWRVAI
jgi:hypothetical protein